MAERKDRKEGISPRKYARIQPSSHRRSTPDASAPSTVKGAGRRGYVIKAHRGDEVEGTPKALSHPKPLGASGSARRNTSSPSPAASVMHQKPLGGQATEATPEQEGLPKVQALLERIEQSPDVVLAEVASGEIARQGQALTPEERAAFVRAMRGRFAWVPTGSEEFAHRKQEEKELES